MENGTVEELYRLTKTYKAGVRGLKRKGPDERLSRIKTRWQVVHRAHQGSSEAANVLLDRYSDAVYNYLLGAVRSADAADELFQEFAVRLLEGKFYRADPVRGHFRDYVKKSLINQVINYRKQEARGRVVHGIASPEAIRSADDFDPEGEFLTNWRGQLLDRSWNALGRVHLKKTTRHSRQAGEAARQPPLYTVLRMHCENPDWSSAQLAEHLTARLRPECPFTEVHVRKLLQRARDLFADLLIDEVAASLADSSRESLEQELTELGLLRYCSRAVDRRFGK